MASTNDSTGPPERASDSRKPLPPEPAVADSCTASGPRRIAGIRSVRKFGTRWPVRISVDLLGYQVHTAVASDPDRKFCAPLQCSVAQNPGCVVDARGGGLLPAASIAQHLSRDAGALLMVARRQATTTSRACTV